MRIAQWMVWGIVGLGVGTLARAEGPREAPGRDPRREHEVSARDGMEWMKTSAWINRLLSNPERIQALGLKPEQVDRLRTAHVAFEERRATLRAAQEKVAIQQARLMAAREIDENAVLAVIDELGKIRTEMAKQHVRHVLLIRRELSTEQIERARRMMGEPRDRGPRRGGAEGPPTARP